MKLLFASLFVGALIMGSFVEGNQASKVKSGQVELFCEMQDGFRSVDADKVLGFQDGVWIFVNGSARNCYVR